MDAFIVLYFYTSHSARLVFGAVTDFVTVYSRMNPGCIAAFVKRLYNMKQNPRILQLLQ